MFAIAFLCITGCGIACYFVGRYDGYRSCMHDFTRIARFIPDLQKIFDEAKKRVSGARDKNN